MNMWVPSNQELRILVSTLFFKWELKFPMGPTEGNIPSVHETSSLSIYGLDSQNFLLKPDFILFFKKDKEM